MDNILKNIFFYGVVIFGLLGGLIFHYLTQISLGISVGVFCVFGLLFGALLHPSKKLILKISSNKEG